MSLIGILTEHKNESYLKKQLEKMNLDDVFFFSENTIENMHNIKFETLLLDYAKLLDSLNIKHF